MTDVTLERLMALLTRLAPRSSMTNAILTHSALQHVVSVLFQTKGQMVQKAMGKKNMPVSMAMHTQKI